MPYARPSTMPPNGVSALESRFSSAAPSVYGSSTQNDDRDPPQTPGTSSSQINNTTWQQNVSTSFAQLSRQFQAASQAVATIPLTSDHVTAALMDRLDAIEQGQRRLGQEIESLTEQFQAHREREASVPDNTTNLEAALKEQTELYKLECVAVLYLSLSCNNRIHWNSARNDCLVGCRTLWPSSRYHLSKSFP